MKQDELSGSQSVNTTEQVKESEVEGAPAVLGVPDPQTQSNPVPGRPKITQAKPLPKITEGQKKLAFWLHTINFKGEGSTVIPWDLFSLTAISTSTRLRQIFF